jgi:phage-related protein (TIGR01555 family)
MGFVKNWVKRWLGVEPPAPPKRVGFFSADVAIPPDAVVNAPRDWNEMLDVMGQMVIREHHPKAYAKTTVGMDGAVTVAMDDLPVNTTKQFALSGFGGLPEIQMEWFAKHSFLGFQLCAMLAQHWFINKACLMPARDAIRNGYDISLPGFDNKPGEEQKEGQEENPQKAAIIQEIQKLDKRFKVKRNCVQAVRMMRVFGIRIVLFEVNSPDPDYYVKPFNADGVTAGSYKGMSQVDPYWITPELDYDAASNPASQFFFVPTYWRINGQRYHRSHLVIITGPEVPDVLKPTYLYAGLSIPQLVYERVYSSERVADEAPLLAMTKRLISIEGVDVMAALADMKKFAIKMEQLSQMRNNFGAHILGQGESAKQLDTTLTDFDALIMTQFQLACATVNVPSTKMLGTQPKGFNATGEYEAGNYREECESIQEHDMAPIIERHHLLCMRSYIMPKFQLTAPLEIALEWNELEPETAKEKSDREKQDADRDKALSDTGAIDSIDIRERLRKDKQSSYHNMQAAIPEGPRPVSVVLPDAPKTAPNTAPGETPTAAPAGGSGGGFGS